MSTSAVPLRWLVRASDVGARVVLHSLAARPELNGCRGTIGKAFDASTGRCGVRVDGERAMIALRPANLIAVAEEAIQAGLPAVSLCMLPQDVIERCLYLTACTHTLARASIACRLLQQCTAAAAVKRGCSLGYREYRPWVPSACATAICELHRLHLDPATARLPPEIPMTPTDNERASLHAVHDEFGHFGPRLCHTERLHLPDVEAVPEELQDVEGDTEYANLAALLRTAGVRSNYDVPSLQRAIEAGWAKGFDRGGAADFGGRLTADACIGASEVLVALWHLRFRASLVEITRARDAGKAVYQLTSAILASATDSLGRRCGELPIFLQTEGSSWLILGVTSQLQNPNPNPNPNPIPNPNPGDEPASKP